MSANTAERLDEIEDDRVFYAYLWGNTSRAARSREAWRAVRRHSRTIAAAAVAMLLAYALARPVSASAPRPQLESIEAGAEDPAPPN